MRKASEADLSTETMLMDSMRSKGRELRGGKKRNDVGERGGREGG